MRKQSISCLVSSFILFVFLYSSLPAPAQTSVTGTTIVAKKSTLPAHTEALPESVGMSSERLSRIDNLVKEYIDKKWIAGATVLVARDGKIVYYKGLGYDDIDK